MIRKSINTLRKINELVPKIRYNTYPQLPRNYNLKWTKEQKKILFHKNSKHKVKGKFYDILELPCQ